MLGSCSKGSNESPVTPEANGREIAGTVWLSTKGVYHSENITDVTITVDGKTTTPDSAGHWKIKSIVSDSVDIVVTKNGYGIHTVRNVRLQSTGSSYTQSTIVLYSLPDYSVSQLTVTPVPQNGSAARSVMLTAETSSPPAYPDVRRVIIFFNKDSIVSADPGEYLFAAEWEFPGQENNFWIPSSENKKKYDIATGQTMYAVAYPVASWDHAVDRATGRWEYFNVGTGRSQTVKFAMP